MYFYNKGVKKKQFVELLCYFIIITQFYLCVANNVNTSFANTVQIQDYSLANITRQISEELEKIGDEELGVKIVEDLYSKLKFTSAVPNVQVALDKIVNNLESKLIEASELLARAKNEIERYMPSNGLIQSSITNCDYDDKSDIRLEIYSPDSNNSEVILSPIQVLNKENSNVKKLKGAIKQIYLLSSQDVSNNGNVPIFNCKNRDQSLLWKLYMEHTSLLPRNIMLLLDHGGSLSKRQFLIVKAVAKQIIAVMNKQDKIGLIAISDEWSSPYLTEQCITPNQASPTNDVHVLSAATDHNKYLFNKFIDSLMKGSGITNHSLGFHQAFNTIKFSNLNANETIMLLYVSRGLLSSLTEAKTVLETIAIMMEGLDGSIIINSCAVIDDSKPVIYETHFLRDIAEQNYTKYNIENLNNIKKGIMIPVNSSQAIGLAVARFYNFFDYSSILPTEPQISLPVWDNVAKDVTISISTTCGINGSIGLLGLDLFYSNLVEDVTYYSNFQDYAYAFIIDTEGTVIMHPSYPRPTMITDQIKFVDIVHLEKEENFNKVRQLILSEGKSFYTLTNGNQTVKYVWKRVKNNYIVCIAVRTSQVAPVRPYKVWFPNFINNKLVHHRLDILPAPNLCRHLNQVATIDAGSLYLSASCFQSPFSHIQDFADKESTPLSVQSYMAYLKDNTRLLANPGLKDEVRDEVLVLSHILEFLREQHLNGARTNYIVRRYVTSPTGVLQVFPGGFISSKIEPTKRSWYLRAVEHRHNIILTPPYLDAGGAGYIVTIAYANSYVVTAMDVTYSYVYKLLLERMPFCKNENIKCFMIDDRGYLVYHPNLIDPNGHGPIEQQHIIHKESLVANDLLNRYDLVKKMLCNDYADGTVQRYYKLNTSHHDILVNGVQFEHCVKYQVGPVKNTNIFIGVVNATCEIIATFCPCSMVDRLCLNCNRMEQRECECPCECPLNLNTCTHINRTFMDNPVCSTLPEQTLPMPLKMSTKSDLKSCMPISCELLLTYQSCLGVLGCEWCQYDVDGETPLTTPFCTSFASCFNGILGSVTPYGDAINEHSTNEDLLGSNYSPIGPIVGSMVAAFLVSGLLFICYRSYSSSSVERFYLTSNQENRVRMSDFNMSDDFHEIDNQDKLLKDSKKVVVISPYCVSTGYRRPLTTVESDHGYSTMTPHDESEHLSFAPLEIDSLEEDCVSDATSIHTSISSKPPKGASDFHHKLKLLPQKPDLQITTIPNKVIASVTVHRNMETVQ